MSDTIKFDGLTLTEAQASRAQSIAQDPALVAKRKAITLYKADDDGLALFRAQACNMLSAITVRAVCNRPLKKNQAAYVNKWLCDANPMFREFFVELNRAVGFEYVQGAGQ